MLGNSSKQYGWISIFIHWFSLVIILALFVSGLWMVSLDYYDSWYTKAPHWHKSAGILFLFLAVFRLLWRLGNPKPEYESNLSLIERLTHQSNRECHLQ